MNTQGAIETAALLNLHHQLLKRLYATVFSGDPDSFNVLMDELGNTLTSSMRTADPSTDETAEDIQVNIAVHLVRFRQATAALIRRAG